MVCGVNVIVEVAYQTDRRCVPCWMEENPLRQAEVMSRGAVIPVPLRSEAKRAKAKRKAQRRKGRPLSDAQQANAKARVAAMKRLRVLFPDIYRMFLDEERVRRGLPPQISRSPVDYERTASETLAFQDVYDALQSSGVTDA